MNYADKLKIAAERPISYDREDLPQLPEELKELIREESEERCISSSTVWAVVMLVGGPAATEGNVAAVLDKMEARIAYLSEIDADLEGYADVVLREVMEDLIPEECAIF